MVLQIHRARAVKCPVCGGTGYLSPCQKVCGGDNYRFWRDDSGFHISITVTLASVTPCHGCDGKGWVTVYDEEE
ncbi:MAG TPA: hypothetical protein ENF26_03110 [Methanomicrobia archaeon]|nr:hypothetical protein [Methanomicrobia archaeon]HEX59122.1 hypothetical protein [Methanomicrobia archaeon]